ncbi:MAG: hypothetical protein IK070_00050 [Clostridia bacterium]|nr:hypothetical protein [Clostridia bacterium]
MRKSVIFIISIIYIASIVVVTFFGMKIRMDQFQVYISKIEITSYDQIVSGNKYLRVEFSEIEETSVFITYKYEPSDATHPDAVEFSLSNVPTYIDEEDGEEKPCAIITSMGELLFYKRANVLVTIRTTDGSTLKDSVLVRCK